MNIDRLIRSKLNIRGNPTHMPLRGRRSHFGRIALAQLFNEVGYKSGVEIGVHRGLYAKVLCAEIPGLKYYGVDPWVEHKPMRATAEEMEIFYNNLKAEMPDANLIRKRSQDAVNDFEDGSLDFVYIDGAHDFDNVMMDIIMWSRKVRRGGMVAGHDYVKSDKCGVIEATHSYAMAHNIRDWYLAAEGDGTRHPSWFWVKP